MTYEPQNCFKMFPTVLPSRTQLHSSPLPSSRTLWLPAAASSAKPCILRSKAMASDQLLMAISRWNDTASGSTLDDWWPTARWFLGIFGMFGWKKSDINWINGKFRIQFMNVYEEVLWLMKDIYQYGSMGDPTWILTWDGTAMYHMFCHFLWGFALKHRPDTGLVYGRYLQFVRFLLHGH